VLRNEWVVPPADARYVDAEMSPFAKKAEPLQSSGDSRPQRKVRNMPWPSRPKSLAQGV
jgi:hypothetical protein